MKKLTSILIYTFFFIFQSAISQNPLVKQWDYRYGGDWYDNLFAFQQTADGGYILGGYSGSGANGDKTQPKQGIFDYWVVKLNSSGLKEWDKRFGGLSSNQFTCLQQTADGGYILGGFSDSGIGGDKTQPNWDPSGATADYWVVKINALGIKQWDKRFGGTGEDFLHSIQQTTDGGYILGGFSSSPASGDKTQEPWGNLFYPDDYWIVKIDSQGTKQWDRLYGGSESEFLRAVRQTTDGGYIIGGGSDSGVSGDKTQPSRGDFDYWIIKTDALGNKVWDKRFGGPSVDKLMSLEQTNDGGYIMGGISNSGVGGDKTQATWANSFDFWIVKTDALGNKQWDKDFGGDFNEDEFGNISQTADGGYLCAGSSVSNASGDKTEDKLGSEEPWIVKTDANGNKQWDKDIFIQSHNEEGFAIETHDGCFVITTFTNSWIAGYKTQDNWDNQHITADYWIVKFCDTTQTTGIQQITEADFSAVIYPNPVNDVLTLEYDSAYPSEITIVNFTGEKISSFELVETGKIVYPVNTSRLTDGIYFLIIKTGNQTKSLKFILQH